MIKRVLWAIPSLLVFILGVSVIVGWLAHIPILLRLNEAYSPIVFNSGICFILVAISLFCFTFPSRVALRCLLITGMLLSAIAILELSQDILDLDLGIDHFSSSSWIDFKGLYSSRMALNTSIGFLLAGLVFILCPFATRKPIAYLIEVFILGLLLIGLLGVIGYFLKIEILYSWRSYTTMSLYTAVCFTVVGLTLWSVWRKSSYSYELYRGNEEQKITLLSSLILLAIGLVIGAAGFITLTNEQLDMRRRMFQQLLGARSVQFETEIMRALAEKKAIQKIWSGQTIETNAKLDEITNVFILEGFSAVSIRNSKDKTIVEKGESVTKPELMVRLNLSDQSWLAWRDGWFVIFKSPIKLSEKETGELTALWPLSSIDVYFKQIDAMGTTVSLDVCSLTSDKNAICFPSRFNPHPFIAKRNNTLFDAVLSGKSGVITAYDNRHQHVLAAYTPIGTLNLIMIVKIDTNELYLPIIQNLYTTLPVTLIAILIGLLLLRLEVIPLIRRVIDTEKQLTRSNKLLKASDDRYSLAVRGSNAGLWDWELGSDQIFYSPYLKNLLGYTDEEIPNTLEMFNKHIHPDDLQKAREAIKNHIMHRVPYNIQYRLQRKSGEYHWFQAVGQAKWDKYGRATRMAGSMSDVTEQKISEQRLLTQYAVTQILSEASKIEEAVPQLIQAICEGLDWDCGAIWMANYQENMLRCIGMWCDKDTDAHSFVAISQAMEFSPGKGVLGRVWNSAKPYWSDDVTSDTHYVVRANSAREAGFRSALCFPILLQNKVFGVMEFYSKEIEAMDEELLQMMASIGPQIGQFFQRKNIEVELRESEAHKTAILHSASDSIITTNYTGKIISFNLQTEKMFGHGSVELSLIHIDKLVPGLSYRLRDILGKTPTEFIGVSRDRGEFPVELMVSVMGDQNEELFVIIIRDITERKKVETLKNEFVSVVSHELRTPLTSIRGSLGLMLGGVVGDFSEKAKKLLDIASNNCDRLLNLINDILDVEKIEAGKMSFKFSMVDITKVVKESIATNQMYGEKFGVKIMLTESVSDVLVNVDENRLLQVMANLISNAVKFSPQGELVKVTIRLINNHVRVSVIDAGPGIPDEFQPRIFQKFSQADSTTTRVKGGTGLGLSITKAIIEKFGGTIGFITKPNIGTTFYFDLTPCASTDSKVEKIVLEPKIKKKSILICEDDEDQSLYLSTMLEAANFHVDVAPTVTAARSLLSQNTYDALLLDLILPDQDGIAFIRELRADEKTKKTPIIVLSVIAQTGKSLLNGDAFSVLDWLDKPIDFSKLLKDVQTLGQLKNTNVTRVLHVEDEEDTRNIVKTLLKDTAEVISAPTLREAKVKLVRDKYDLVILDLMLPDGNGSELLPLLAKNNTPVLVFSAVELDREHAECVRDVLVKSETSHERLLTTIEKIIHVVN
jgi:PAS domain S-box-containing protein